MVISISLGMSCSMSILKKLEDFFLNTPNSHEGQTLDPLIGIMPFIRHSVCEEMFIVMANNACTQNLGGSPKVNCRV